MSLFLHQSEADRLVQAATAAIQDGDNDRAATLLDQALQLDPRHLMAMTKLAEVALARKNPVRALALTGAVLNTEPNFAPAWNNRAVACWLAGRSADAVEAVRRALDIQPHNPDYRLRFVQFAAWTGRGEDARTALLPLLAEPQRGLPDYAMAVSMLGELEIAAGRFQAGVPHLDQALAMRPDLNITRMLRGMNQLRLGSYVTGWPDYAAREKVPALYPNAQPALAREPWTGEQDLAGKTIVVGDDQGHGDAIQFFRYAALLRDLGATVIWGTFPALVRIFTKSAPYATISNEFVNPGRYDFYCNSTSLPRLFRTDTDTIPSGKAYLKAPVRMTAPYRRRSGRNPRVGLAWSGDARHMRDHLRSIPAALFLKLADRPGIDFHSLQFKIRPADRTAVAARPAIDRGVEQAADFADTAALIARLDLVIAVDTGVAHLAAALGKPVWLIVHVAPDWRWMADRDDSPWYPSVRLFRVTHAEWVGGGNWQPVLTRVAAALDAFAAD